MVQTPATDPPPRMIISIIVAVAENGVIGRQGALPWRLSADLRRFQRLTMGHMIVMGRRTWESIGRSLPGRQMIVVSRQANYRAEGVQVVASLENAMQIAQESCDQELFIIGGAEIYRQALPHATRLYLTRVCAEVKGDTQFPEIDFRQWNGIESESHKADDKNDYDYCFELYERVSGLQKNRNHE